MAEITKEELQAYTDAALKTATALEKIVDRLESNTALLVECKNDFDVIHLCASKTEDILKRMDIRQQEIASNVIWVKWLWTILAAVVGLGMVILQIMHKVAG